MTTRWTAVVAAGKEPSVESRRALEELAQLYWYPLYAFVRRKGHSEEDARDLTQGFFALLLERGDLARVDREKGRFRAYLLTSIKHFLINERERAAVQKRGGGVQPLSIDAGDAAGRYAMEPAHELSPEKLFERSWANSVLERAMQLLREEYDRKGRTDQFECLHGHLTGDIDTKPLAELAARLAMTESGLKVALFRLRKRYGLLLRAEIADTVADPRDVEDEIHHLFEALGA